VAMESGDFVLEFTRFGMYALCPLLDAGLDLGEAFTWAVLWGNVDAAKICFERGADPKNALEK
jgi:hypothetical protein